MVKFILLGHGRSGSTLLVKNLIEHPGILMDEELFHPEEAERFKSDPNPNRDAPEMPGVEIRPYRDGEDGAEYLREAVFCDRSRDDILAVGFKLFYTHARGDAKARTAWDYLIENRDVRVVHLVRVNLLESFLSLKVAFMTGEWRRWKGAEGASAPPTSLRLEPRECEEYFNEITAYRAWARDAFRRHPFLEIEYERDVCARYPETMGRVYDFLCVPRGPAEQLLEKQSRRRPRETVSNYAELKEHFRPTAYGKFFEEV
jgi:LPS sulfotransferase NodH